MTRDDSTGGSRQPQVEFCPLCGERVETQKWNAGVDDDIEEVAICETHGAIGVTVVPDDSSDREVPGQAYRRVSRGEWWHRPTCWMFGHRWTHPEGVRICTRCDRGELEGEHLVEADLEVNAINYNDSE